MWFKFLDWDCQCATALQLQLQFGIIYEETFARIQTYFRKECTSVTYRQADKEELGTGTRWSGPGGEAHLQGARPGPASSPPTTYKLLVVVTTVLAAYPGWRAAGFHYVTCTLYNIIIYSTTLLVPVQGSVLWPFLSQHKCHFISSTIF